MNSVENWQRLSPWALVFIVVNGLIKTVRRNIGAFLGAGAGFAFIERLGMRELGMAALLLLLIAIVASMIYHRRFRFRLEDDAIRIRSGLLEQKELRIRFARVLNVNLSQPFYLRPLGLMRFSLDTAGAAKQEVELPGISSPLAEQLRQRIAVARKDTEDETDAEDAPPAYAVLYRARERDLLLHGLASNQLWVLAGAFFGTLGFFNERLYDWGLLDRLADPLLAVFGHPMLVLAAALGGLFLALALLSMLISWLRFSGFQLQLSEDGNGGSRLISRAGLLDRKEQTLPVEKLHAFELVQTAIGRLLGRWYLIGRQAGTLDAGEQPRKGQFLVPGLDGDTARALLAGMIEAGSPDSAALHPGRMEGILPLFKRVMALRVLLIVLPASAALALFSWFADPPFNPWLASALACVLALLLVWQRWRRWGQVCRDGRAWVRHGLFGQRITTFSIDRVQQVQIRQSPVQHRKHAANLVLVLPHGPVTVPFLPVDTARPLANEVLYRVETAEEHRI